MTMEELDAAAAAAHAETIERLKAKPITVPPGRETFVQHFLESYKHVPHHRAYGVDLDGATAGGTLAQAFCDVQREEHNKSFSREEFRKEILEPLTTILDALTQQRPREEGSLPTWPVDE